MSPKRAPFITFEGGEGTGKSTQIKFISDSLRSHGKQVVCFREPGGTEGAEQIRSLLVKGDVRRWDAVTEALLMFAARRDLVERAILPSLQKGVWVLCDRFFDSSYAYQGFGHGLGYDKISELAHFTLGDFEPDLTFIFTLPPNVGLERAARRDGDENRYEGMDSLFHTRVVEGYKEIAKRNSHRCIEIDAVRPLEEITRDLWDHIERRFL